jgi:hypothetical protein
MTVVVVETVDVVVASSCGAGNALDSVAATRVSATEELKRMLA